MVTYKSKENLDLKVNKNTLCVCEIMKPVLNILRILGTMPITWEHKNEVCTFSFSYKWMCVSLLYMTAVLMQLLQYLVFDGMSQNKQIIIRLSDITDIMFCLLIVILSTSNLLRSRAFIKFLNKLQTVVEEIEVCYSARKLIINISYAILSLGSLIIVIQYSTLFYLDYFESERTHFGWSVYAKRFMQNCILVFSVSLLCLINVLISLLACFEKLTISCLKYTPVHPLKAISETNNWRDFLGVYRFQICKELHTRPTKLLKLTQEEMIEYLRCLHEDICSLMHDYNLCLNPQVLVSFITALLVLIVQLYSVIIYIAYDISSPETKSIFILNCLNVTVHAAGLFLIFKNFQEYENMVSSKYIYLKAIEFFYMIVKKLIQCLHNFF